MIDIAGVMTNRTTDTTRLFLGLALLLFLAMTGYKRGDLPEEDLEKIFNTTMQWLRGISAATDPALHLKLAEARPALWRIASAQ